MKKFTKILTNTLIIAALFSANVAQAGPGVRHYNLGLQNNQAGEKAVRDGNYIDACDYYKKATEAYYEGASADEAEASRTSVFWEGHAEYTSKLRDHAQSAREDAQSSQRMRDATCGKPNRPDYHAPQSDQNEQLTRDLKPAKDQIRLAIDQSAPDNTKETCAILRRTTTYLGLIRHRYVKSNARPEDIKRINDNIRVASKDVPATLGCPSFSEEKTAYYINEKRYEYEASGTKAYELAQMAENRNDYVQACAHFKSAASDFNNYVTWNSKLKTAYKSEGYGAQGVDEDSEAMREKANQAKLYADKTCAKIPR